MEVRAPARCIQQDRGGQSIAATGVLLAVDAVRSVRDCVIGEHRYSRQREGRGEGNGVDESDDDRNDAEFGTKGSERCDETWANHAGRSAPRLSAKIVRATLE